MSQFNRRTMVKLGAGLLGSAALPGWRALALDGAAPHFFLQVVIEPGLDASYLFDARPLALTAAGKKVNYLGTEPVAWTGSNQQTTWATSLVEPLKAFRDSFSVLNGVHMATTDDGHDQNMNYWFTGNPLGGESFMPHLNRGAAALPLDALALGTTLNVSFTNSAATVPMSSYAASSLSASMQTGALTGGEDAADAFLRARMAVNGPEGATGLFARGIRDMLKGWSGSIALAEKIKSVVLPMGGNGDNDDIQAQLKLIQQYFMRGITRSALIVIERNIDTHDATSAKALPTEIGGIVADLATLFAFLKSQPYDAAAGLSLLDVTTVLVGSEFSRTMRQKDKAMDASGTDHNSLTNTFLIGGKGIKGGKIIGESDMRALTAAGELDLVSGAHQQLDGDHLKIMGRPYDFAARRPAAADVLPATYDPKDYLSVNSVANTLYKLFDVADRRKLTNSGPEALVIDDLLSDA